METLKYKYAADGAYPDLADVQRDLRSAKIIQNLYAGKSSELSAITQYCYQAFVSQRFNDEINEVFLHIAEVEMHHLELLANAIIKLGGNPTFSNSGGWWSGSNVYYNNNIINMINRDIRDEELAILDYKKAAAFIKDAGVDALLNRIIADEEVHIEVLTRLKEAVIFYLPEGK